MFSCKAAVHVANWFCVLLSRSTAAAAAAILVGEVAQVAGADVGVSAGLFACFLVWSTAGFGFCAVDELYGDATPVICCI